MKFRVGDKVEYIGKYSSFIAYKAIGIIIRQDDCGYDVLFSNDVKWWCTENNLVKISTKGQQLLFDFYEQG